jgi:hypothetical protein
MRAFSLSDRAFTPPGLAELRKRHRALLHVYPALDPSRSLLNGVPVTGTALDEHRLFSVPTVLLEALPVVSNQYLGVPRPAVWATPNTETLRASRLAQQSSVLTVKRAATLYRAVSAIEGVRLELDPSCGLLLPQADLAVFAPDVCWPSNASAGGGHTSPTMRMDNRMMTVATALFNLAYPCKISFHWKLRRQCPNYRCVNPWHYIDEELKPQVHAALQVALAVPLGLRAPLPLPRRSPVDGLVDFTATWAEWTTDCERLLHAADKGPGPAAAIQPEKMEPEDVLALF